MATKLRGRMCSYFHAVFKVFLLQVYPACFLIKLFVKSLRQWLLSYGGESTQNRTAMFDKAYLFFCIFM